MRKVFAITILIITMLTTSTRVSGFSLALDSVAEWGKFPRFCVNTYRWGDRFFNTYDSAYVEGTGYKFNVKLKTTSWTDNYVFALPDNYEMRMRSDFCTASGLWLTYLAVSVGYDINVSKFFGGSSLVRKKFNFRFNSAILTADLYWVTNDIGTTITSFGERGAMRDYNMRFTDINNTMFGLNAYHYLNSKRYSNAAAFNYSKNQKRSQGSFFVGFSYYFQDFNFNFKRLPAEIVNSLPESWARNDYFYYVKGHNYQLLGGYGYNWVFARHWLLGITESPLIGLKHGRLNAGQSKYTLSLNNRAMLSVVWNNKQWFAGLIGTVENGLVHDKDHSLINGIYNIEASVGWRFNLW